MNIAFFNRYKSWGGGEKWHYTWSKLLSEEGHKIFVFCDKDSEIHKRLKDNSHITLIPIVLNKYSHLNPLTQLNFYRLFKKLKLNAIIFNDIFDVRSCAKMAKWSGVRHIVYRNGMPITKPLKKSYLKAIKHGLTQIVCLSYDSRKMMLQNVHILNLGDKITTIPNAFDLNMLPMISAEVPPDKKYQNKAQIVLINTARLTPQKGHKYLLEATQILKAKSLNFKILIIGTGELKEELCQYANQLNVTDRIEFLGFKEDIYPYLLSADIFVFPSLYEGMSNSIIEAMACKLPTVCFNASSMKELVKDNETGLVAESFDSYDFAEKIASLILDQDKRIEMGKKAYEMIQSEYNTDIILQKWESLLVS